MSWIPDHIRAEEPDSPSADRGVLHSFYICDRIRYIQKKGGKYMGRKPTKEIPPKPNTCEHCAYLRQCGHCKNCFRFEWCEQLKDFANDNPTWYEQLLTLPKATKLKAIRKLVIVSLAVANK
jgi:hypothetical protein